MVDAAKACSSKMNNMNGRCRCVTINIPVENNEDADDAAIASAEKIRRRTSEEEAFDAVVNARYACTRFQCH